MGKSSNARQRFTFDTMYKAAPVIGGIFVGLSFGLGSLANWNNYGQFATCFGPHSCSLAPWQQDAANAAPALAYAGLILIAASLLGNAAQLLRRRNNH